MWQLGLTDADRATFEASLASSHVQAVRLEVLDHDERPLGEATQGVLDAGVTFDLTGEVTRTAEVTVARGALQRIPGLDQIAYTLASPGLFLRVVHAVYVEPLERWVEVPLFTGPVWASQTQGDEVQLSAVGKEALLQPPHYAVGPASDHTHHGKGKRVTDAIADLLRGGGEHALGSLPTLPKRLQRAIDVGPEGSRWALARRLADGLDRTLWFDGEGRARLEQRAAGGPVFTFTPAHLLTEPAVSYSLGELRNANRIGYGKGARSHVLHVLGSAQPASGTAMARRNGVPRLMVETLDDEDIEHEGEARAQADRMLTSRQLAYNVTLDAVLVPHLEPGDTVAVNTGGQATPFVFASASLGLSADGGMTVNYLRRLPRKVLLRGRRKR